MTNIKMFLDVHRPRNFDAGDLRTEIPSELAFYFCYCLYEANASETGKILIKDIKGGAAAGQQTWTTLEQSTTNLSFLFSLLKNHLEMNKALPGVQTLSS